MPTNTPKPDREPALDFYLKSLETVLLNSEERKCKFNVSKEERDAIIGLRKNNNIVIFEADKGGAVVVVNKTRLRNRGPTKPRFKIRKWRQHLSKTAF